MWRLITWQEKKHSSVLGPVERLARTVTIPTARHNSLLLLPADYLILALLLASYRPTFFFCGQIFHKFKKSLFFNVAFGSCLDLKQLFCSNKNSIAHKQFQNLFEIWLKFLSHSRSLKISQIPSLAASKILLLSLDRRGASNHRVCKKWMFFLKISFKKLNTKTARKIWNFYVKYFSTTITKIRWFDHKRKNQGNMKHLFPNTLEMTNSAQKLDLVLRVSWI